MTKQDGQVLILALIFLAIMALLAGGLFGYVGQNVLATRRAVAGEQALQLADAGIEKAVWQLNETGGSYTGETETLLGPGEFDVSIENISANIKEVTATGYVPRKSNPRKLRTVKVQVNIDTTTVNFNYGVQVGDDGLVMDNNSQVTGNVFVNGTIDGGNDARITGDAFSAGSGGRITDRLQIDGDAHAHRIDGNVAVGGSAFGQDMDRVTVGGNVWTHTIRNCTVGGNVNYTVIESCTVGGSQNSGYPGADDPEPQDFPISDSQIQDWKNQAEAGGVINGDYTVGNGDQVSLGPKKITGDLEVENNGVLTLTGPIWVVGEVDIKQGATVRLDPSYGTNSEVFISDEEVQIENNSIFHGSGEEGSYLMMISTDDDEAFEIANNADALIVYAPHGEVEMMNNSLLREVTAWGLRLRPNAEVVYESGLSNVNFTGGPGASWQIIRGTWREIK